MSLFQASHIPQMDPNSKMAAPMKAVTSVLTTRDTPKWELMSGRKEAKPLTTQMMLLSVKLYDWGAN